MNSLYHENRSYLQLKKRWAPLLVIRCRVISLAIVNTKQNQTQQIIFIAHRSNKERKRIYQLEGVWLRKDKEKVARRGWSKEKMSIFLKKIDSVKKKKTTFNLKKMYTVYQ